MQRAKSDPILQSIQPTVKILRGDARHMPLPDASVDLIVTSPPYWRKRDYGVESQIGQEQTPQEYVAAMMDALTEWKRVLRRTGSVFLNIGDTYWKKSLAAIPARIEAAASDAGWIVRNRIIWAKNGGFPEPAQNRLANRHEYILHLTVSHDYYYDMFGYAEKFGNGANPGDVWQVGRSRHMGRHLAPFPEEIVERAIFLACPEQVCTSCMKPLTRILRRTAKLDTTRPQARRALEIAAKAGLTDEHIAAIQATGISDAGKALLVQNGTGRNSARVKALAKEAKKILGGYFREFTFAKKESVGWQTCDCNAPLTAGVVLDPFTGTGTTLRVASSLKRSAIGVDLDVSAADLG